MERPDSGLFDRYYESWWGIEAAYDKIAATHGVTSNIMNIITLLYKKRAPLRKPALPAPGRQRENPPVNSPLQNRRDALLSGERLLIMRKPQEL